MLRIIDRYLLRELLASLLAVGAVLLLISIGETVVAVLSQVTRGRVPADLLFTLIALRAIDSLNVLLPLAVFLGVLLAFGRLYRDSEMSVLAASGLDLPGLLRPLALLIVPMFVLMSFVSFWLAPSAVRLSQQMISDSNRSLLIAGLEPGRFVALPGQEGVIFVGQMSAEGARFERMFVENERVQEDGSSQISVITAARGQLYRDTAGGERFLALEDGFRVEGTPGQDDYRLLRFARNDIRLPENEAEESPDSVKRAAPLGELWRSEDPLQRAELHWRLAPPLSAIVLALLALPLSRQNPRQPRYASLIIAVLAYIAYANFLAVGRSWLAQDTIDFGFGLWWVYLPTVAIAALLLWRGQPLRRARAARRKAA